MSAVTDAPAAPIDPDILEEAADWLVQLHAGAVCNADRAVWERWRERSPEHARAWARAELLLNKLGGVPPSLAMPTLARTPDRLRRTTVIKLAALMAAVPAAWLAWPRLELLVSTDYRTSVGERRDVRLADGTSAFLNTDSAVAVRFDESQRRLVLQQGEVLVTTAPDNHATHRSFIVASQEGRMEALGTRFSVRQEDGHTRLTVFEGAVRITLADSHDERVIEAGEQTRFTRRAIAEVTPADDIGWAWTQGMLVADNMRLDAFAAELARYRSGLLRTEPSVAGVRISGSYPLDDTDQTLAMLVTTYPVDAVTRFGGRWVTFVPRVAQAPRHP
ncbi:sensor [Oxalicibacterium flavum]|uniref:Sensor n=1 Tax=Oxalicibacterium flavum TaxID=179467 RepID=A0A8J2UQH2_9BURK|nr:FecR domain-containing protein [Oxalicibacterium flavum]GGC12893.1 sensor [Oxalicibacterium flavum]